MLTDALDYMKQNGWHKGSIFGPDGSVCALGACSVTLQPWRASNLLDAVAEEQYPERVKGSALRSIAALNDHPDTTFEELEAVFEKAQIRLDEGHGL